MNDEKFEVLRELSERYDVHLDFTRWQTKTIFGGVGMSEEDLIPLRAIEEENGFATATVYEMESLERNFAPVEIPLSGDGLRTLRSQLMGHFDLLIVPRSRKWSLLLTNELQSIIYGPQDILERI